MSFCCIVLQVYIRIRDDEWNIYRRYAQFYSLHKELKKYDAIVSTFDFPPKKTLGNKVRKCSQGLGHNVSPAVFIVEKISLPV